MKKNIIVATIMFWVMIIVIMVSFVKAEIKWLPYYAFNLSEGIYLPSVGRWGISTNLSSDIGFIVKPSQKHTVLLFYELKYSGPGLKRQEGEKFEQRNLGHLLMGQYNYQYNRNLTFKTRLSYITDWWRSGTNELWGYGIYDSIRLGISEDVELVLNDKVTLVGKIGFSQIRFPNYTNLIEEFQAGAEETTSGKQDNNLWQLGVKTKYLGHIVGLNFNNQAYLNQKILDESGTYTNKKQSDLLVELFYNKEELKIVGILWTSPLVSFKYKDSNQGYLHFKSITSTPTFIGDFYDYSKMTFSIPLNFDISKTKYLSIVPEYEITTYGSRPRRNENNDFISGEKHITNLTLISFSYTSRPDNNRKMTLFYTFQTQTSTTKFDQYFPYNYSGNYFGMKYSYSF